MRLSLGVQGKFVLIASLCIFFFAGVGGCFFIRREVNLSTQDTIHQARVIAEISGVIFTNALVYKELELIEDMGLTDYLDYYVSDMMNKDPRILYLIVQDPRGKVLAHSTLMESGKHYADPVTAYALQATSTSVQRLTGPDGEDLVDVATPLQISTKSWGVCRIGFSLAEVRKGSVALRNEVLSMVALFLVGSFVVIGLCGKAFATPLIDLAATMDRITEEGNLSLTCPEPGRRRDEIGRLQASFSWMIKRLHEANRERLRTMDLMCQTEKMATVGNLAAGVAHEINNPLGGVILCFKNFTEGAMDEESRRMHIEVINSGLLKIQHTVRGLLDFARKSPLAVFPISINDIIEESCRLADSLLGKKGISVTRDIAAELPMVTADPGKIGQVFLNIILNAIHAMADKGHLNLAARRQGEMCLVTIADDGAGIDPEILPRIFDPFFTTKEPGKGTGLGLAVCKSIVEQHGGRIEVQSQPGQGARFLVSLPVAGGDAA
ncbi:MAG: hypothetical protein BWK76_07675 [Desulfobulbaceae bacterium A2]|nr:MAG: hypothetical protein BWK76_07675 [Desulfobulbaceae bacterium A2]